MRQEVDVTLEREREGEDQGRGEGSGPGRYLRIKVPPSRRCLSPVMTAKALLGKIAAVLGMSGCGEVGLAPDQTLLQL